VPTSEEIVMGQSPVIALLPSALLGPAVWQPVLEHLRDAGHEAVVAGMPGAGGTSVSGVLTWYLDSLPAGRDYVLVPHSNAGLYVPAITGQRSVTGLVFVDAILPPRAGTVTVAPEGLQKFLGDLAGSDGVLPVWTSWWPESDVAALFPSEQVRNHVSAEQRPFPLSYFAETVTVGPGWSEVPAAYLGFGDTYEPERAEARSWGWRAETLDGEHLHMLTAPDQVAAAIARLRA
jgi:hypothetical protein